MKDAFPFIMIMIGFAAFSMIQIELIDIRRELKALNQQLTEHTP